MIYGNFAALFAGRVDAYGTGRGGVVHEPLLLNHYVRHLAGEGSGLGVFPLRDDGTARFGAIDLDEPNFELARTLQLLLPGTSWVEQSRSGNAHVWAFFAEDTPAWAVRDVLRHALEAVGRPDVEIFPKQDRVREGGVGNYINLPFHGLQRPIVEWVNDSGARWRPIPMKGFVAEALAYRSDPESWERRARTLGAMPPEEREATAEWGTAPVLHECAQYIIEHREDNPLRPGHRSVVLFNLAKQLLNWRDANVDWARYWVHIVNEAGTRPAPRREVDRQFQNALDGRFTSTGCDDPLMLEYVSPECPIAFPKS